MTIQDLIDQFEIQGAYCIKRWRDDWNDYAKFAEGKDFEGAITALGATIVTVK